MANILRLSPDLPISHIPEQDVTIPRLSDLLTSAVIEHETDEEGDLYANEGLEFPCWVRLDTERKLIVFLTYAEQQKTEAELREDVNLMNRQILSVQFHADEGRVWGQYVMTYDGGLNGRQFIKMLRRLVGAFRAGVSIKPSAKSEEDAGWVQTRTG